MSSEELIPINSPEKRPLFLSNYELTKLVSETVDGIPLITKDVYKYRDNYRLPIGWTSAPPNKSLSIMYVDIFYPRVWLTPHVAE
jgi:hypothetical protein